MLLFFKFVSFFSSSIGKVTQNVKNNNGHEFVNLEHL